MANTVFTQALLGCQATLQALSFTGIGPTSPLPATQIVLRKLATDRALTPPLIFLSIGGDREDEEEITTASTIWRYPVRIDIETADNQALAVDDPRLTWRRQIRQAFHRQRPSALATALQAGGLPAGISFVNCWMEPEEIMDPHLFHDSNLGLSDLLAWVRVSEPNGS